MCPDKAINNNSSNEVLSIAQARMADRLTIEAGTSSFSLLSTAGLRVFEYTQSLIDDNARILVACGTGNNGGDGLITAQLLIENGYNVDVALMSEAKSLKGDAHQALQQLSCPLLSLIDTRPDHYTLIIDAVLGVGLDRCVSDSLAVWIRAVNESSVPVISIDIPTGIHGETGAVLGVAIRADHTVTFYRKKIGHLLYPGRAHAGHLSVASIGISDALVDELTPTVYENLPSLWKSHLPVLSWSSHKYERGYTVVLVGTATGAARLTAYAALRAGAGVVTLASPSHLSNIVASHVTCEMIKHINNADELQIYLKDSRITSVVLGPGMGISEQTRQMVSAALTSNKNVLLDADAISSFENLEIELFTLIAKCTQSVVLTPHKGEFQRLFKSLNLASSSSKVDVTREAARQSGAVVVYKGADTVIAAPSGRCAINTNSPVGLATAGSGDVLVGTIAGWISQNVGDFEAACMGCWLHGEAATEFGPGLIASDIANEYPKILKKLASSN